MAGGTRGPQRRVWSDWHHTGIMSGSWSMAALRMTMLGRVLGGAVESLSRPAEHVAGRGEGGNVVLLPEVVAAPAPARQPCSTLLRARHPSASLREGKRETRDLQQLGRPRLALLLARGRA